MTTAVAVIFMLTSLVLSHPAFQGATSVVKGARPAAEKAQRPRRFRRRRRHREPRHRQYRRLRPHRRRREVAGLRVREPVFGLTKTGGACSVAALSSKGNGRDNSPEKKRKMRIVPKWWNLVDTLS